MNFPFYVKFVIFDQHKNVTKEQQNIKKQLHEDLNEIFKNTFNDKDDDNLKFLDRCEAAVSSINEIKQLRLCNWFNKVDIHPHSIVFHQLHCHNEEYFTIEELKYISHKIKHELELYLH